jgi:hypothetical protein
MSGDLTVSAKLDANHVLAWSTMEKVVYIAAALAAMGLAYGYCFHMDRTIVFDETGLHNPIYTYLTTDHMTYPMHGYFDFMVVHSPTHYFSIALIMKAGLPLLFSSAVLLWILTVLLTAIIYTGRFSFIASISLLLGFFTAIYIWSEFYTIRPDLMVTAAWFVGLVTFQAARNNVWSLWRLFLGSLLLVYAACSHYWGVASLLGILVFIAVLARDLRYNLRLLAKPLAAIALGGSSVGIPYLTYFVVPYHSEILAMIQAVQGTGGPADAFRRHLASYDAFSQRINFDFGVRWLVSVLTSPVLLGRLPAAFVAFLLLVICRELRVLAAAGIGLPLFVLFYSQGKQVGYTGYFTPEMILYFVSIFYVVLKGAELLSGAVTMRRFVATTCAAAISVIALVQVPVSAGLSRAWTRDLDILEILRAAAVEVLGPDAVVGTISAGNWFTAGGRYLWNAFNELTALNKIGNSPATYLARVDALAIDTNYWNATPEYAPVGEWYANGDLKLRGFVFPTAPTTIHLANYFVSSDRRPVIGFFVKRDTVERFDEVAGGSAGLIVLICQSEVHIPRPTRARYSFAYSYNSPPGPMARQMVFILADMDDVNAIVENAKYCVSRDLVQGTLTRVDRETLKKRPYVGQKAIEFYATLEDAVWAGKRIALLDPSSVPPAEMLARALSLPVDRMIPSSASSIQHEGDRVIGRSPPIPWAYIGKLDLEAACIASGGWVAIDLRVNKGQIGVGVLNRGEDNFLVRRFIAPRDDVQSVYLPVESYHEAGGFIVQNGERAAESEVEIRSVKLARSESEAPALCSEPRASDEMLARAVSLPLDRMMPSSADSIWHEGEGVIGRSPPIPWAYIGKLDLEAACIASGGWVAIDLRVNKGQIGVGVSNRAGDHFLTRRFVAPSDNFQSVYLPVESYREAGGFIVQNGNMRISSEVEIRSVKLTKNDPDAPFCAPAPEPRVTAPH